MRKPMLLPCLIPVLLAACTVQPPPAPPAEVRNGSVSVVRNEIPVAVDPSGHGISAAERDRVARVMASLNRDTATHVTVAGPALNRPARNALLSLLADAGIPEENVTFEPDQSGGTRLRLTNYVAVAPDCSGWGDFYAGWYANAPTQMMGCSNQRNLMLMLVDPRDAVQGRRAAPTDGDHAARAVQRYRADKVKKLPTENKSSAYLLAPAMTGSQETP